MRDLRRFLSGLAIVALIAGTGTASAQDKAAKQREIEQKTSAALDRFYKADPKLKAQVGKAPGYAVFTTYGFTLIVGGAGGTGLVHDNKSKKNTFMNMAQASAGVQVGGGETDILIVFNTQAGLQKFVDSGWEFGAGGGVEAGAAGKSAGKTEGTNVIADASFHTLTKNGLQAGGAVAGTKFWKDKDLN